MTSDPGGKRPGAVHIGMPVIHAGGSNVDELTRLRGKTPTAEHVAPARSECALPTRRDQKSRIRPDKVEPADQGCQRVGERRA